jgi:hypothetical protein
LLLPGRQPGDGRVPSMSDQPNRTSAISRPPQTVYWLIAVLLAVIATALWMRPGGTFLPVASAQNPPGLAGARGIYAFTGPLERDKYGLFMLDVDQGTIWCYGFESTGGTSKLRLVAARTWVYDRYLQDFNCAAPDFRAVQRLVNQQRLQSGTGLAPTGATTDEPPRPADNDGMRKQ